VTVKRTVLTTSAMALLGLSFGAPAFAKSSCSTYPTAAIDKIDSTAIDSKFGPLAAPPLGLHFAYAGSGRWREGRCRQIRHQGRSASGK
jgi:hypothetical protein